MVASIIGLDNLYKKTKRSFCLMCMIYLQIFFSPVIWQMVVGVISTDKPHIDEFRILTKYSLMTLIKKFFIENFKHKHLLLVIY